MTTFTETVRQRISQLKLSGSDLAARAHRVGLKPDAFRTVLRGFAPSIDRAAMICQALDLELRIMPAGDKQTPISHTLREDVVLNTSSVPLTGPEIDIDLLTECLELLNSYLQHGPRHEFEAADQAWLTAHLYHAGSEYKGDDRLAIINMMLNFYTSMVNSRRQVEQIPERDGMTVATVAKERMDYINRMSRRKAEQIPERSGATVIKKRLIRKT